MDKLINNYQSQFSELYKIFGDQRNVPRELLEEFKAKGRTKRATLLKALDQTGKDFTTLQKSKNWQSLTKAQQQKELDLFKNLGIDARQLRLKQLEQNLRPNSHDKAFQAFQELDKKENLHLTDKINNFPLLTDQEKAEKIGQIRRQIINLINNKYAPHDNILSKKDLDGIANHLPRTENADLAAWYLNADRTINDAKTTARLSKDINPKILEHFEWNNLFTHERLQLLQDRTIEKHQDKEQLTLDTKYTNKLDKYKEYKGYGLINDEGKKAYLKWYRTLSLEQKTAVLEKPDNDYLEQTHEKRQANVDQFLKLTKPIQKEYQSKFKNADFEKRTELITQITTDIETKDTEFTQKVNDMVENGLLSPKSADAYTEWFNQELTLKDKTKFLTRSDLDKPERKQIYNLFQQITDSPDFKELPAAEQKKSKQKFDEADLEERIKLVKKLGKTYLDDPITGVKTKDLLNQIRTKNQLKTNALEIYADETEELTNKGENYENEGKYEKAKTSYTDALDLLDKVENPEQAKELQQKINEMEELQNVLDGIETESPLNSQINHEIDTELRNPTLQDELTHFSIMYMAYKAAKTSEMQTKTHGAQNRVHNGLHQDTTDEIDELDDNFAALTNQKTQITEDEKGLLGLTETIDFRADEFDDHNNEAYDTSLVKRLANLQTRPATEQRIDELRLVDEKYNELTANQYYKTMLAPKEAEIQTTLTNNITKTMGGHLNDAPIIQDALKNLINKKVTALDTHRLTIPLVLKR
ncbi:hypothetical protein COV81_02535 [Candidatus Peregrinibacteria bacterium CG11_big_fil_rev_8_21_14_0_20_41_10]|nr:MAG: hypothetical protein COV81_02535 [Candidatus Peregrinibacteria bacterium CG11_big_fil_rev_8_21_14_0_20_41_10]PJC38377.1 MAG: hypothetical protein CO045_00640 [Candidatus Peregrinibacteria bacterium CG_4_9_14_0_2_um_filter_41_14]